MFSGLLRDSCGTLSRASLLSAIQRFRDDCGTARDSCGTVAGQCPVPAWYRQFNLRELSPRLAYIILTMVEWGVGWDLAGVFPQRCMPSRRPNGVGLYGETNQRTLSHRGQKRRAGQLTAQSGNSKVAFFFPSGAAVLTWLRLIVAPPCLCIAARHRLSRI